MLWRNVRNIILHQRHLLNTFLIFFLLAKFSPEYVLNKVVAAKFRKSCFGAPHINGILLEKFFFRTTALNLEYTYVILCWNFEFWKHIFIELCYSFNFLNYLAQTC